MEKLIKNSPAESSESQIIKEANDDDSRGNEAIYKILVSISEKWWGKNGFNEPSGSRVAPQPEKMADAPKPVSVKAPEDLEQTIILSGKPRSESAGKTGQTESDPEKPASGEVDLEKTIILSGNSPLKPFVQDNPAPVKKEDRTADRPDSKEPEWDDLEKTVILPAALSHEESLDDQTLIITPKADKREILPDNTPEMPDIRERAIAFGEQDMIEKTLMIRKSDDDDIILETVTLGPDSYE
ncbi:MAG: hypothetical protein KJ737_08475 [Proteobacteria bacterium]|nr:hypothetical protein [Pseudomonadota bacterium]